MASSRASMMISLRSGVEPERRSWISLRRLSLSAVANQGKNSHQRSSETCACADVAAIARASPSDTVAKILARAPRVTSLLSNGCIVTIGAADDLLHVSRLARILHEHNAPPNWQKTLAPSPSNNPGSRFCRVKFSQDSLDSGTGAR